MKITYIARDSYDYSGVRNKIYMQCKELTKIGCSVSLLITGRQTEPKNEDGFKKNLEIDGVYEYYVERNKNLYEKTKAQYDFMERVLTICKKTKSDILYIRYTDANPIWIKIVKIVKNAGVKVIYEHQSKEFEQNLKTKAYIATIMEILYGRTIRKAADGIVGVTEEILRYEIEKTKRFSIKAKCLGNGVSVEQMPIRRYKKSGNETNVLFVGNTSIWHGLDRVLCGMAIESSPIKMNLHIVGSGSENDKLKKRAKELNIIERVFFYGERSGKELDEIYDYCDVAIGSLGIHRKGLNETSELKAREYCARGIPFVSGGYDADFTEGIDFRLGVKLCDEPLDCEAIKKFAVEKTRDPLHPEIMREYANRKLNWSVKARELYSFFQEVLSDSKD